MFDEAGGGLLILGSPGSGKTTALLELARDLLDRAVADERQPISVVFNLSSWATQQPALAEWLVDELHERYDVARSIGRQWVDGDEILPLLDGLDEVARSHRADCVEAINAFHSQRGPGRFAVCSRMQEYTALDARLRVEEAVELAALFDDYTRRMLEHRPITARYTPDRMLHWLSQLARAMRDRSQSEFQLDRLTSDWLPSKARQRRSVFRILTPTITAGLATGLILGPVTVLFFELTDGLPFDLFVMLEAGLRATLFFWLVALLAPGLLRSREAEPVEEVRWSWSQLTAGKGGGPRGALRGGLVFGLASVLYGILDALVGLSGERVSLVNEVVGALISGLAGGLRAALRSGLSIGLPVALFFWLIGDPTVCSRVGRPGRSAG